MPICSLKVDIPYPELEIKGVTEDRNCFRSRTTVSKPHLGVIQQFEQSNNAGQGDATESIEKEVLLDVEERTGAGGGCRNYVYFVHQDTLWSVAKKYNTTIDIY